MPRAPGARARLASDFLRFSDDRGLLRFGEFRTKSGRVSPYFFNTGMAADGRSLAELAGFYLRAARLEGLRFDAVFGSAYKGIPLAAAIALAASEDQDVPPAFAFDRKEAKDHGEAGRVVGRLEGGVLLVDDVITSGASILDAAAKVRAEGASPCGVLVGLDRGERASGSEEGASDALRRELKVPVVSIVDTAILRLFLEKEGRANDLTLLEHYLRTHGG